MTKVEPYIVYGLGILRYHDSTQPAFASNNATAKLSEADSRAQTLKAHGAFMPVCAQSMERSSEYKEDHLFHIISTAQVINASYNSEDTVRISTHVVPNDPHHSINDKELRTAHPRPPNFHLSKWIIAV